MLYGRCSCGQRWVWTGELQDCPRCCKCFRQPNRTDLDRRAVEFKRAKKTVTGATL